jgi:hypothetical protein
MRKFAMAAAGLVVGVIGTGFALAPTAEAATPCPRGAFCIRETNGTLLTKNIFWSFAPHNLSNVVGERSFANNQTANHGFKLCTGYNGGGQCGPVYRYNGELGTHDFTTINSVVLVK